MLAQIYRTCQPKVRKLHRVAATNDEPSDSQNMAAMKNTNLKSSVNSCGSAEFHRARFGMGKTQQSKGGDSTDGVVAIFGTVVVDGESWQLSESM